MGEDLEWNYDILDKERQNFEIMNPNSHLEEIERILFPDQGAIGFVARIEAWNEDLKNSRTLAIRECAGTMNAYLDHLVSLHGAPSVNQRSVLPHEGPDDDSRQKFISEVRVHYANWLFFLHKPEKTMQLFDNPRATFIKDPSILELCVHRLYLYVYTLYRALHLPDAKDNFVIDCHPGRGKMMQGKYWRRQSRWERKFFNLMRGVKTCLQSLIGNKLCVFNLLEEHFYPFEDDKATGIIKEAIQEAIFDRGWGDEDKYNVVTDAQLASGEYESILDLAEKSWEGTLEFLQQEYLQHLEPEDHVYIWLAANANWRTFWHSGRAEQVRRLYNYVWNALKEVEDRYNYLEGQAENTAAESIQRHYNLPDPPTVVTNHFGQTSLIPHNFEIYPQTY